MRHRVNGRAADSSQQAASVPGPGSAPSRGTRFAPAPMKTASFKPGIDRRRGTGPDRLQE
jgi:hypothetical protein